MFESPLPADSYRNPILTQRDLPKDRTNPITNVGHADLVEVLTVTPAATPLDGKSNPTSLGRRQQHLSFEASTALRLPESDGVVAGLAALQSQDYWYWLACRREGSSLQVFLERKSGGEVKQIAAKSMQLRDVMRLKIAASGRHYSFFYGVGEDGHWQSLLENDDGSILSTEVAGGFVGATVGPYARSGH